MTSTIENQDDLLLDQAIASTHVNPAVHVEHRAAYVAGRGRAEECDRPRDFVWDGHSTERNAGKINGAVAHHRCIDRGRRNAVDQDVVRSRSTG
jgi:hypothetical protein